MAEDTSHPIHALPDRGPAWCITDHSGAVHEPVHWTTPEEFDTLGEHAPAVREQVRVQGSLHHGEVPPARVHVDTRLGDADLWRAVLVMTPGQARHLSACVVLAAEIIGAAP
jgi:hypothetical protein